MKFTWLSNAPWSPTGYGNQTKVFLPRFQKAGHDPAVIAFYGLEGGILGGWNDIPIYPKFMDAFGNDVMIPHTKFFGASLMFSLMDTWVIKTENIPPDIAWIPWFPIDSDPIPPEVYRTVKRAFRRIVFSKFGVDKMNEAGLDHFYVPHGVDTGIFNPEPMDEAREKLGIPKDAFVVGMNAANKGNPSRKAFTQNIQAFAWLKNQRPDAVLFLHTMKEGFQGVDLPAYLKAVGLEEGRDVFFSGQYHLTIGYPDSYMRTFFSALDVHLLVSMGEGFGIPIVESQACGTPVIVGDWTSMGELCFSGWKVPIEEAQPVWTPLRAYQFNPNVGAIYDLLQEAYEAKGNQELRRKARSGALEYDADLVMEKYWTPVLKEIEEAVEEHFSHRWSSIGVYRPDGSLLVPTMIDGDPTGLVVNPDGTKEVDPDLFPLTANGVDFSDLEWAEGDPIPKIVIREIAQDYRFEDIPFEVGDIVIDIGAHVGIVSYYLAKKYGVFVEAYEPDATNFEYLQKNIVEFGAVPLRMAVTGDGRKVEVYSDGKNSGGSNILGGKVKGVPAKSLTLKDVIGERKVKLLKIDAEGAEYEIIRSDPEVLRQVEYLRGEIHPIPGEDPKDLLDLISKYFPKDKVRLTVLGG